MCVLSLFLCSIDLLARSSIHANACAGRRAELHGKKRRDFEVVEQIGGAHSPAAAMDAVANQAAGVYKDALHGANSRIFAVKLLQGGSPTGCGGKKLVLKVCINMNPQVPPMEQFAPEFHLLMDDLRLPPHPNVMCVFTAFEDTATGKGAEQLPHWDLDSDWVVKKTAFITMPFFPRDLKNALASEANADKRIAADRARRLGCDLLRAAAHLHAHHIVHRDFKPDNIMLDKVGTPDEKAVVTDFGLCHCDGFQVPYEVEGFNKGGAISHLPPEILGTKPGAQKTLDYTGSDAWSAGLVIHEILACQADHAWPGADSNAWDCCQARDADYIDVEPEMYDAALRDTVCGLLRVSLADRLSAAVALTELEKPLPAPPAPPPAAHAHVEPPWPGELQDQWNPLYEGVKLSCMFGSALDFLESGNHTCANYRSGGPTGWTLLHQAAFWKVGLKGMRPFLERLRDVGAHPLLLAQNKQQMDDGAGTFTPLEITAPEDVKEEREAWRKIYVEVFGLGVLVQRHRGGGGAAAAAAAGAGVGAAAAGYASPVVAALEPEPDEGAHLVDEYKHLINGENGLALTAVPSTQQDGSEKCEWGARMTMQPRSDGNPAQRWRLHPDPNAHLQCEANGQHMLDIDSANVAAGAHLVLWQERDKPNQRWSHTGEGELLSRMNGLALEVVPPGGTGATVRMWTKEDHPRQQWRFEA